MRCLARHCGMQRSCIACGSMRKADGKRAPSFGGGYRRSATLDRHVRAWTSEKLGRAMTLLSQAIGRARREPALSEMIAVRALWAVALAARSKA